MLQVEKQKKPQHKTAGLKLLASCLLQLSCFSPVPSLADSTMDTIHNQCGKKMGAIQVDYSHNAEVKTLNP